MRANATHNVPQNVTVVGNFCIDMDLTIAFVPLKRNVMSTMYSVQRKQRIVYANKYILPGQVYVASSESGGADLSKAFEGKWPARREGLYFFP